MLTKIRDYIFTQKGKGKGKTIIKEWHDNIFSQVDTPYLDVIRSEQEFKVPFLANQALKKFISLCSPKIKILDIGSGVDELHAFFMRNANLNVQTNDIFPNSHILGLFENLNFKNQFDAVWCAHVLEHTLNPHNFLQKINQTIKENGILCITVPPLKHEIVGGHINLFNPGLLIYRLILAGFDCSNSYTWTYGYNISIIMKVRKIPKLPDLIYDNGDIEILAPYFPMEVKQNFDGNFNLIGNQLRLNND